MTKDINDCRFLMITTWDQGKDVVGLDLGEAFAKRKCNDEAKWESTQKVELRDTHTGKIIHTVLGENI